MEEDIAFGTSRVLHEGAGMRGEDGAVRSAWLMLAAGEDREHGGNDGYDDAPSVHYTWDSTVANGKLPQPGDVIVLWDKRHLLGASVIEKIEQGKAEKIRYRCSLCGQGRIKKRKNERPRYRCDPCRGLFDEPVVLRDEVRTYRTRHDAGWVDLTAQLAADELRSLCLHPKSQLSIRQLDYARFRAAVAAAPGVPRMTPFEAALTRALSGHREAIVRVRVGQGAFRQRLLATYGDECAFTGPVPRDVLDAAHLYSYAADGRHHDQGGLLMRKDIHRLFDVGHLAVNPSSIRVDVTDIARASDPYKPLHGKALRVTLSSKQLRWIREHWIMHRK